MEDVIIKSVNTAAKIIFSDAEKDYFTVSYQSPDLQFSKRVWGYTDCEFLIELFEYMEREWKGWEGEQKWASIEGDFSISCLSDKKGHIRLKLNFIHFEGAEPWKTEVMINLETGLMPSIAKNIRCFFAG